MKYLASILLAHGNTVRFTRNGAVYAACPATLADGSRVSELSGPLASLADVRQWLGY